MYDGYAGGIFREHQQRKLARMLMRASDRGVTVFTSNIDCDEIRGLYGHWAEVETVPVRHNVGAKAESRRKVDEVLMSATSPYMERNQLNLFDSQTATHDDGLQA